MAQTFPAQQSQSADCLHTFLTRKFYFIETSIIWKKVDGQNKGEEVDNIFILNYAFPLLYERGQFRKIHEQNKKGIIIGN
jgi:hypothetical protein